MCPIITTAVVVRDDQFKNHVFLAGQNVPDWAAKKITTPSVWEDASEPTPDLAAAAIEILDSQANATDGDQSGEDASEPTPDAEDERRALLPPKSGPHATVDAWIAYAAAYEVKVDEDATRKDIIAALTERGIPTE